MKGYGQFCPVAMAAALLSERWTLLVVRELLMGSRHFNQLRRGVPLMSPTLLSTRLQGLYEQGVVTRVPAGDGHGWEYGLTDAGRELFPLIEQLGHWGKRWIRGKMTRDQVDLRLLMWAMHREFNVAQLPPRRINMQIELSDGGRIKHWWMLLEKDQGVDLCLQDPGFEVDLLMHTDALTLAEVYMGDVPLNEACACGRMKVEGPPSLVQTIPKWFSRSLFADVPVARGNVMPASTEPVPRRTSA